MRVIQKKFIGTWKLVSTEERLQDGRTRPYPDLGEKAVGYLMYTEDGHMCATLMNPERPKWQSDEVHASDAERISAASGFTSYCGTYRIDEDHSTMLHYPEISFRPNYIGTELRRPYRFEGDRLVFSDKEAEGEVARWTITWERVSSATK